VKQPDEQSTTPPSAAVNSAVIQAVGGKYVTFLQDHLARLRKKYDHGNRVLFYDHVVTAYLTMFFNPMLKSLRAFCDWSESPQGTEFLGSTRFCRSTFSDANALMDATLLEPLIEHLRRKIPDLQTRDGQLGRLLDQVRVVDGSFFAAAADVAWAIHKRSSKKSTAKKRKRAGKPEKFTHGDKFIHKVRLDLHMDGNCLPVHLVICGKGCSESQSAAKKIDPHAIYIVDRGYNNFKYVSTLLSKSADLVLRLTEPINFDSREEQILDEDDRAANVLTDRIGQLSGSPHTWKDLPRQELREVVIFDPDHPDKPIRLITSILDLPAHVIGQLYRWRWQIELFFRWLKVHAHFKHMISHSRNGMTMGFYVAVIAILLMYLHTGRPMSKYAYALLAQVASGWATIEDILPILERRERECEMDRQRQAKRRAAKIAK
jgi:hypothetical protein